jgi:RNA polymerase sigma-70 factor (ECF subfamily)
MDEAPDDLWARRYAAARTEWPHLQVTPEEFRAHVEARWPDTFEDHEVALADLFLTCGCTLGRHEAFAAFDKKFREEIEAVVKRLGRLSPSADDARQLIHERLLTSAAPKIAEFRGRGSLKSWVRVVALRTLLNHRQRAQEKEQAIESDSDIDRLLPAGENPELALMKQHYAAEVRAALRDCIGELNAKERTLLRLAFVEGATVDAIGAVYGVHRATAGRWVQAAHRSLTSGVHRRLRERLRLKTDELESALRLISSGFDTSIARYLE